MFRKISLDAFGMSCSILCAIHCALTPIIISATALSGIAFLTNPLVEQIMVIISLLIVVISLIPSYRKHHKKSPLTLAAIGFFFIVISRIEVTELWEVINLVIGAIFISTSHYINWKKLKEIPHQHEIKN